MKLFHWCGFDYTADIADHDDRHILLLARNLLELNSATHFHPILLLNVLLPNRIENARPSNNNARLEWNDIRGATCHLHVKQFKFFLAIGEKADLPLNLSRCAFESLHAFV